jgi:hypothetical protein
MAAKFGTLTSLGEGQKPESAGSHARGRRGLGQQAMEPRTAKELKKRGLGAVTPRLALFAARHALLGGGKVGSRSCRRMPPKRAAKQG